MLLLMMNEFVLLAGTSVPPQSPITKRHLSNFPLYDHLCSQGVFNSYWHKWFPSTRHSPNVITANTPLDRLPNTFSTLPPWLIPNQTSLPKHNPNHLSHLHPSLQFTCVWSFNVLPDLSQQFMQGLLVHMLKGEFGALLDSLDSSKKRNHLYCCFLCAWHSWLEGSYFHYRMCCLLHL